MIRKKIKSFSIDVIGTLLRGTSSKSHVVSDFEVFFGHIVVSCQCRLESLKVLGSLVTLEGWSSHLRIAFPTHSKSVWDTTHSLRI